MKDCCNVVPNLTKYKQFEPYLLTFMWVLLNWDENPDVTQYIFLGIKVFLYLIVLFNFKIA